VSRIAQTWYNLLARGGSGKVIREMEGNGTQRIAIDECKQFVAMEKVKDLCRPDVENSMPLPHTEQHDDSEGFLNRLWIYTNYDCNLSCSYCAAESFVGSERKALALPQTWRLIDEALEIGMTDLFFTGGEPFILQDIFSMLEYGLERMNITVLSNGILLKGRRLEQLKALPYREHLTIQISLDGSNAAIHDSYRGHGSWKKAIDAIERLKAENFHVRLGTTQTPENSHDMAAICQLHRVRGISDEDHIIRPLVRRGFSAEGMAISLPELEPEVTVNRNGVYWHPVATDPDLRISPQLFPLIEAVERIKEIRESLLIGTGGPTSRYR
jgi:pyruvate-formate lyase-activating enzyme